MTTRFRSAPFIGSGHQQLSQFERQYPGLMERLRKQAESLEAVRPYLDEQQRQPARPATPRGLWVDREITQATADDFVPRVSASSGDIRVYIDSPGGLLAGALQMAAALRASGRHVTGYVLRADSAAIMLSLGCNRIVGAADATAHVHEPRLDVTAVHNARAHELHDAAGDIAGNQSRMSRLLGERTGMSSTFWGSLMSEERTLDAADLLAYQLLDEVSRMTCAEFRRRYR